jgi:tetratricopeptide (TPR) repeat protein
MLKNTMSVAFIGSSVWRLGVVLCLGAFLSTRPALAEPSLDVARAAFAVGDFDAAARAAREINTSAAAALAAQAGLAQGDFEAPMEERRALFMGAEKDARRAIDQNPDNPEGHLYLALALGFLGRLDGSMTAHFAGYAKEARLHIDRALVLDPTSAWGHALDGGWNLDIVRDGGILGEALYGASFDKGRDAYRHALSLAPDNTAIAYQFALQLLGAGGQINRAEAYRVLARALNPKDENAVDRLARQRAQRLKLALDTHDELSLKIILREGLGTGSKESGGGALSGGKR